MEKVPTPLDEFNEITEEKILKWAEEISNYKVGMPITSEKWCKIQIVAAYVFNKSQLPS